MADRDRIEQLNDALEGITPPADREIREMLAIAGRLRDLPSEDFRVRLKAELKEKAMTATEAVKPMETTAPGIMPYLIVRGAAGLVDFMKQAFGGEEMQRYTKPDGTIMHTAVRIGDSVIEMSDDNEQFPARPAALHIYLPDSDAAYRRALAAGAMSLREPMDQPYGDHEASVQDRFGNKWYIATYLQGSSHIPEGFGTVTPYLHTRGTDREIEFLKQAFGAEEAGVHRDPADGLVVHATIRLGDSVIEMGEAHGPHEPMPIGIHYYVSDTDAVYRRAVAAGGISKQEPGDRPYGERNATVTDPAGNDWFIATRLVK